MSFSITVVIPVRDDAKNLQRCLAALYGNQATGWECIVVDDNSKDDCAQVAQDFGAKLLHTPGPSGPAAARNLGAGAAAGDILLFIDADVCVQPDTIARIHAAFAGDPQLDAVIGSYDDEPAHQGFISQYRNLMHCFVHQNGREDAFTFWSGCGAIRRELFQDHGGFNEDYRRPAIEDIELGARLRRAGARIRLDRGLRIKHLKRWTFWQVIRTDVLQRGIPWSELILREGAMPDDLNLQHGQRWSVVLAYLLLSGLIAVVAGRTEHKALAALMLLIALTALIAINRRFYAFLFARRGPGFVLAAVPMHVLYHFYNGISFAIGALRHLWRSLSSAKPAIAFFLCATLLQAADEWLEFRSAPFQVVTNAGEKAGREATNQLVQMGHVLGQVLGKPEIKTVFPIRFVLTKARTPFYPQVKLARDAYVAAAPSLDDEAKRSIATLLIDSNAGTLPQELEHGLIELFSTFRAEGTRITLGIPPPKTDRDWARIHLLTTNPAYSGKLRVLLYNLQQGVDPEPAYKNAFGQTQQEIEKALDKHMAAGTYEPGSASGKAINPNRELLPKGIDRQVAELTLDDVLAAHGDTAAKARYRATPALLDTPVPMLDRARAERDPIKAKAQFQQLAKSVPTWSEPYWYEAQIEDNPMRKVLLLKKAAELAPRRTDYWLALAKAQETVQQFADAVKSWAAAERAAPTEADQERIRQLRRAGEEQRQAQVRAEKEEAKRKSQAEIEALKQKALESIRTAEARANAGKAPLDTSTLEEYREDMGYGHTSGQLQRVECFGKQAVLHIVTGAGTVKLHIADPSKVAITGGGEHSMGCGLQKPARELKAEYVEKKNAKLGTAGEVTNIEFR